MIPQDRFVAQRSRDWQELDRLLEGSFGSDGAAVSRVASLYRSLCNDLMRCRGARYAPDLVGYLNGLAGRAHSALYGVRPVAFGRALEIVLIDFPVTLRKNWRFFLLAFLLFAVPWAVGQVGAMQSVAFAREVLPQSALQHMADMYSEELRGREGGQDATMAGYYVYNNVGIAFRCFATGILFGLGSIFFLVYNGLMIGTVTGYVWSEGYAHNLLTFMCGHAPFELTAIVIAGAAGMRMGYSLVSTGGRTRVGSLRNSALEVAYLVVGAAVMLVIAAAIEGFWSPSGVPAPIKWVVSAVFWIAVAAFLGFAGRGRRPKPTDVPLFAPEALGAVGATGASDALGAPFGGARR